MYLSTPRLRDTNGYETLRFPQVSGEVCPVPFNAEDLTLPLRSLRCDMHTPTVYISGPYYVRVLVPICIQTVEYLISFRSIVSSLLTLTKKINRNPKGSNHPERSKESNFCYCKVCNFTIHDEKKINYKGESENKSLYHLEIFFFFVLFSMVHFVTTDFVNYRFYWFRMFLKYFRVYWFSKWGLFYKTNSRLQLLYYHNSRFVRLRGNFNDKDIKKMRLNLCELLLYSDKFL